MQMHDAHPGHHTPAIVQRPPKQGRGAVAGEMAQGARWGIILRQGRAALVCTGCATHCSSDMKSCKKPPSERAGSTQSSSSACVVRPRSKNMHRKPVDFTGRPWAWLGAGRACSRAFCGAFLHIDMRGGPLPRAAPPRPRVSGARAACAASPPAPLRPQAAATPALSPAARRLVVEIDPQLLLGAAGASSHAVQLALRVV